MQLGMVGLGRMGANMVRRLCAAATSASSTTSNPDAVEALERRGRDRRASLDEFVAKLSKPRAAWVMVPAALAGQTVDELAGADRARRHRSSTAATATTATTSTARAALEPKGIHYVDVGTSGGVFGLERGFCLMIGGEHETVERLDPIFRTLAPGRRRGRRARRAREGEPSPAEQGYLHCGPAGAGHFVKMVHNGIEYGLMAAYAEGFNILQQGERRQARQRAERRRDDAAARSASTTSTTSTSPRSPRSGGAAAWSPRGCST